MSAPPRRGTVIVALLAVQVLFGLHYPLIKPAFDAGLDPGAWARARAHAHRAAAGRLADGQSDHVRQRAVVRLFPGVVTAAVPASPSVCRHGRDLRLRDAGHRGDGGVADPHGGLAGAAVVGVGRDGLHHPRATVGTYALNAFALRHADSSVVGFFIFLQPLIATAVSALAGNERLDWRFALAAMLVAIGVAIVLRRPAAVNPL